MSPHCASNRCRSGRAPCPTPLECGLTPPDVPPCEIGEDESGPMERLERWEAMGAGIVKGVVAILILLLALFAVGELRDYRAEVVKVQR